MVLRNSKQIAARIRFLNRNPPSESKGGFRLQKSLHPSRRDMDE